MALWEETDMWLELGLVVTVAVTITTVCVLFGIKEEIERVRVDWESARRYLPKDRRHNLQPEAVIHLSNKKRLWLKRAARLRLVGGPGISDDELVKELIELRNQNQSLVLQFRILMTTSVLAGLATLTLIGWLVLS